MQCRSLYSNINIRFKGKLLFQLLDLTYPSLNLSNIHFSDNHRITHPKNRKLLLILETERVNAKKMGLPLDQGLLWIPILQQFNDKKNDIGMCECSHNSIILKYYMRALCDRLATQTCIYFFSNAKDAWQRIQNPPSKWQSSQLGYCLIINRSRVRDVILQTIQLNSEIIP